MKTVYSLRVLLVGSVASLAFLATAPFCSASEDAEAFLAALRARGLHDVALDYLDKMATSPLVTAEFKQLIQYEKGATMVAASRSLRDFGIREGKLNEAQKMLEQFIKNQASHPLVSAARSQLGNLLVERARLKIERGKKNQKEQAKFRKEARALYDQAYKVFTATKKELKVKLSKIPKVLNSRDKQQAKMIDLRDRLRAEYLQAQLLAAAVLEETADTETEGSKPYNDLLTKAALEYSEIYEKYRTRLAGLYARLYQGRCNLKLKKHKDALSYFADLLEQPDQPEAFRALKTKTLLLAVESWLDQSQNKFAVAIAAITPLITSSSPVEAKEHDLLSLRLSLARAHRRQSDHLKETRPRDPQIARGYTEAKKLANYVARIASPHQKPARRLLIELPGGEALANAKPQLDTFVQAKTAGKDALDTVQVASEAVKKLAPRMKAEKDPAAKAALKELYDEALLAIDTGRADAIEYFLRALEFDDDETSIDEINVVQYFLCYLYYIEEDYYKSAILGELLARRYPDSSGARQGAKIAMACYVKLFHSSQQSDKGFETQRLIRVADYLSSKWPDQPEAIEALNTLIPFMINAKKLDQAIRYLHKIPATSSRRGPAELKTGQAFWNAYLVGMQQMRDWEKDGAPDGVNLAEEKARLDELKKQALKTLADGVSRLQKTGNIDATAVTGVLSLAQIYVDTDQPDKAVATLENPKTGALTLVQKNHPATKKAGFAEETYKTALRAYISSLAKSKQSDAIIKKAQAMMDALKKSVGDDAASQKKLVGIYISLARDLEEQIKLAPPQSKPALLNGFETFLKRVGSDATELNILYWVAETFFGMGESVNAGKDKPPAAAVRYYENAIAGYQAILDKGKQDPKFLEPNMRLQLRMRMATSKRLLGQHEAAIDDFVEILKDNNVMLPVQIAAAETYQDWASTGEVSMYNRAIRGDREDKRQKIDGKTNRNLGRNIIWGWGKLGQMTAGQKRLRDAFHQSRYNLAICHFEMGKVKAGADKKRFLNLAKREISLTKQLYPDMGGEAWEAKYNALLKKIQKELGEKPLGLAAIAGQNG